MRSDNRCNRNLKRNYKENQEEELLLPSSKGKSKGFKRRYRRTILDAKEFRKKFSRIIKKYIISLNVRRYLKLFFYI